MSNKIQKHPGGRPLLFKTEKELQDFLIKNPDLDECVDCIECEDANSITLEDY